MVRTSKLIAASGAILAIAVISPVQAGPTGTPAANRVLTGNGQALGGLFDGLVGGSDSEDAKTVDGRPRRKHLTSKQWHEAYKARHGHDLPSPLDRPGGH